MDNNSLVNKLISKSLLQEADAQKLLGEAAQLGKTVEDIIVERRLVNEIELAKVKSEIVGIPYAPIDPISITPELLQMIPEESSGAYTVVPISVQGKMLVVGMVHPEDNRAQEALKFIAKQQQKSLGIFLITKSDFDMVMRKYRPYESEVKKAVEELGQLSDQEAAGVRRAALDAGVDVTEEGPIIKIVSSTIRKAVESGASDIHIEPGRDKMRVRFRIDGDLEEVSTFPAQILGAVVSRIKVLTNLKIDETRVPQDGRFRDTIFGRDIDFRVATFPTPNGEKVAIRILDPEKGVKDFKSLGLSGRNERVIREAIDDPFGMILVTGPTGSGKSTTLYAILEQLNQEEVNIVSLEDPVEYFIEGVNQSQVKPEIGYTFASGLRQILRQDPDVIMVGEIRDDETAELAIHAALTGHVVLSTLHANNTVGVVPRLTDMGVHKYLIPAAVNVMVAQRLLRRLDPGCREEFEPSLEIQKIIEKELSELTEEMQPTVAAFKPPYKTYRPSKDCEGSGYKGRIAVFEVLEMTRDLEGIINTDATEGKIYDEARKQGVVTMRQDGIIKALQGVVSIEEVLRETNET
ncbi:MAG: hypothetical protein COT88_00345 [Candidatus Colwellbacteria bacterium CG10_big_fil_rev_8_21_14_0_10_41_28]|uniref:Bacterial type II secretion system protein E domain-containing protein n=1 Tax=Candidatus Colwellbacteria bacterium CG10_big_fil_rev_8_21_14_0_10_41_28 TaxID=1974539 RepID=A0A2H0VHV2_9BACT|nr:MAG: hypothetical protein COT88_00345 [Candidatus Colwellbacteria bacterium CG10_big_fil_rev_8_21_14_0_10_41_28]